MRTADVAIVGGGALGLCLAAELGRRGGDVVVVEAPGPPPASAVAGGMLAPAFEAALDPGAAWPAGLGRTARDLWPALADRIGVRLHRAGAEWRGPDAADVQARMQAAGFAAEVRQGRLFTDEDWWLDPTLALEALAAAPRVRLVRDRVRSVERSRTGFRFNASPGAVVDARAAVLAGGVAPPPPGIAWRPPVRPVKGQIARLSGGSPRCVVRGPGVYVVPAPGGAVVGATMEPGRLDLEVEPAVIEALIERARAVAPELEGSRLQQARAGVRGESPDGLPLAGLVADGLAVSLAPRRNGWLFAPLMARIVADSLEGRGPDTFATAMDPTRFDAPTR